MLFDVLCCELQPEPCVTPLAVNSKPHDITPHHSRLLGARAQATLQQLQGDLDALKAQHAHTQAELAGVQEGSAVLQSSNQELKARAEGLEQQLTQVWGGFRVLPCCLAFKVCVQCVWLDRL